jgi:WD40 repeat protein
MSSITSLISVFQSRQIVNPISAGWTAFAGGGMFNSIYGYKRVRGDAQFPKAPISVSGIPFDDSTDVRSMATSPDGLHLAVGSDDAPFYRVYKHQDADTIITLTGIPAAPSTVIGAEYSRDGRYLALALRNAPYVMVLKREGDTYTRIADPELDITGGTSTIVDTWSIRAGASGSTRGYTQGMYGTLLVSPTLYPITQTRTDISPTLRIFFTDDDLNIDGYFLEIVGYGIFAVDAAYKPITIGGTVMEWPVEERFANNTDYVINVWDGPIGALPWYPDNVREGLSVAWSPDGGTLILGYETDEFEGTFEVFTLDDDTLLSHQTFISTDSEGARTAYAAMDPGQFPYAIKYRPDGSLIYAAVGDVVRAYDPTTFVDEALDFDLHEATSAMTMDIARDGSFMVVGTGDTEYPALAYRMTNEGTWVDIGVYATGAILSPPFPGFPNTISGQHVSISPSGRNVMFGSDSTPYVVFYRTVRSSTQISFTKLPNPDAFPDGEIKAVGFLMKSAVDIPEMPTE